MGSVKAANHPKVSYTAVFRTIWPIVSIATLAVFVTAVPFRYQMLLDDVYGYGAPLAELGLSLRFFAAYFTFFEVLLVGGSWAVGVLIAWRKSGDWFALLTAFTLMLISFLPPLMNGLIWANAAWTLPVVLLRLLCFTGLMVLFSLFPNGRLASPWLRFVLVGWLINAVAGLLFLPENLADTAIMPNTNTQSDALWLVYQVVWFVPVAVGQWYRYRRVSTAVEQQQTKWVVLGFIVPVLISFFNAILLVGIPSLRTDPVFNTVLTLTLGVALLLSTLLIPLTLAFAIFRYRLWQIDIILNRTLVYGSLTGLVTAVYVLLVSGFGTLAANQQGTIIAIVVTTVIVVVLIRPLLHWLQSQMDKLLPIPVPSTQPADIKQSINMRPLHIIWAMNMLLMVVLFVAGLVVQRSSGYLQNPADFTAVTDVALGKVFADILALDTRWLPFLLTASYIQAIAFAIVGLYLFWRKSGDVMGVWASWMLTAVGVGFSFPIVTLPQLEPTWHIPTTIFQIGLFGSIFLFLCLFPDGRFYPKWTQIAAALWLVVMILWLPFPQLNPHRTSQTGPLLLWVAVVWLGIMAQIIRYRRLSHTEEKQQTKWVIVGFFLANGGLLGTAILIGLDFTATTLWQAAVLAGLGLASMFIPITISVALFRYRLWQLDIIINRTLVYGGLTAVILLIYGLVVGGFSLLWRSQNNLLISLLATGLIAVLFQPVRERLQRAINKMTFGDRDDPAAVLARLGQRLEAIAHPDAVLPAIVETVAQALKLPYVAVMLQDKDIVAATGVHFDAPLQSFPLVYQAETIGQLQVTARSPGEVLSEADEQVLRQVALQAGTAVHAIRLTHDLQQSRIRLVTTREEERRRLRRDLHDELGPLIASQGLKLAAVRELMRYDPETAVHLLDDVLAKNQNTVADVRRLVYNLRPPTLDELGLVGAIHEHVQNSEQTGLKTTVTAPPDGLPPLSAAVEAAAYRIVLEAFTNVMRHARAKNCEISLRLEHAAQSLIIQIQDNGVGLSENGRHGIGLTSMRERAEEVGGSCKIVSSGKGVRVTAVLPSNLSPFRGTNERD